MPPNIYSKVIADYTEEQRLEFRDCTICLMSFEEDSVVRITICYHIFHSHCLENWFNTHDSCPICRMQMSQANIEKVQRSNILNESGYLRKMRQRRSTNQESCQNNTQSLIIAREQEVNDLSDLMGRDANLNAKLDVSGACNNNSSSNNCGNNSNQLQ